MTYQEIKSLTSIEKSKWIETNYQYQPDERRLTDKVCGVGDNDAPYHVCCKLDGKRVCDPAYVAWGSMLRRCYSDSFMAWEGNRSYQDVTVCQSWHTFMNFREWWLDHYREGYYLDKDLLTGGKEYSPDACLYVPAWLNNIATDCRSVKTSGLPMGVHNRGNKYITNIHWVDNSKRGIHLGSFNTPEEAHATWLLAKVIKIRRRRHEIMAVHPDLLLRLIDIVYDL